jgi:metal-responsive CopG/Arc/MetJ family transcriptional regulator
MIFMKAISIKIPDPLFHDLMLRAKANAISQSEIIRSALSMYLYQGDASETVSCAQRANRWIGIVDGPPDLSTNGEHLAGFGQ